MLYPTEFKDVLRALAGDLPGEGDVRHRRVSLQRSARRRRGVLDGRPHARTALGRGAGRDDRGARDYRARRRCRWPAATCTTTRRRCTDDPRRPSTSPDPPQLRRRVLSFRDLLLFYVVTGFSLRWVATAAAAGPSALVIWVIAALGFFVPLVFCVLELSSRYPEEGGIYVWSKRAFGPFAAFITGWTYWGSNLPYFPGLLYFAAANALFMGGPAWQSWSSNSTYFIAVSMAGLALAVAMNVVGLNVGKWLNNVGAIAGWIPAVLLIVLGAVVVEPVRIGDADHRRTRSCRARSLKDVIFWSTIAFAFGGVESGSTMGEEIEDARRTVPRAILAAGAVITVLYIAGDAQRAARDAEGAGLRPAGHHAGDSGDDREGRRRRGWRRSSRRSSR